MRRIAHGLGFVYMHSRVKSPQSRQRTLERGKSFLNTHTKFRGDRAGESVFGPLEDVGPAQEVAPEVEDAGSHGDVGAN